MHTHHLLNEDFDAVGLGMGQKTVCISNRVDEAGAAGPGLHFELQGPTLVVLKVFHQ